MRFPHRIALSVPHPGTEERLRVEEVFASNWLSTVGPHLSALEEEFENRLGLPAVALSSGTAALHLAVRLAGVRPGDEVVLPTLTFVATANVVRYEGGQPVLLDSERQTWGLDPALLDDFLSRRIRAGRPKPRAVIVAHLFGEVSDVQALSEVCRRHDVLLIEDAANGLGSRRDGRWAGTFGDLGVFSLGGNKIITATCGGILVSPRREWVDQARGWASQARQPDPEGLNNYIHTELGYNYRLSNLLAGVALGQMTVLEDRIAQRRAVFARYAAAFADLPGIEPQPEGLVTRARPSASAGSDCQPGTGGDSRHTRWLSTFLVDETRFGMGTADLIRHLDAANIEARPVWRPMHRQALYADCERVGGDVADDLHRRGICLPSSSSLTEEELNFVISQIRGAHAAFCSSPRAPAPTRSS